MKVASSGLVVGSEVEVGDEFNSESGSGRLMTGSSSGISFLAAKEEVVS